MGNSWTLIRPPNPPIPPINQNTADLDGYYSEETEVHKIDPQDSSNPPNYPDKIANYRQRGVLDPNYPITATNPTGDKVLSASTFNGGKPGGDFKGGGPGGVGFGDDFALTYGDKLQFWKLLKHCEGTGLC